MKFTIHKNSYINFSHHICQNMQLISSFFGVQNDLSPLPIFKYLILFLAFIKNKTLLGVKWNASSSYSFFLSLFYWISQILVVSSSFMNLYILLINSLLWLYNIFPQTLLLILSLKFNILARVHECVIDNQYALHTTKNKTLTGKWCSALRVVGQKMYFSNSLHCGKCIHRTDM